jgi:hypothetical protein
LHRNLKFIAKYLTENYDSKEFFILYNSSLWK